MKALNTATNYSGMGKSAADTLPELRRKGITASGNRFSGHA